MSAQCLAHQLHSITYSQHRQTKIEDRRIALRRTWLVHASRSARKDDPLWRQFAQPGGRYIVPNYLAVYVLLPNTPGDELGVLRTEIQDQNFFVGYFAHVHIQGGKRVIINHKNMFASPPIKPRSIGRQLYD